LRLGTVPVNQWDHKKLEVSWEAGTRTIGASTVSTGGFSKEAKYEADRISFPLTLLDIDDLVEVVIEYYEQLALETRTLLPLSKIYWPSKERT